MSIKILMEVFKLLIDYYLLFNVFNNDYKRNWEIHSHHEPYLNFHFT